MDHAGLAIIFVTTPTPEVARTLVHQLVSERLIACGTILDGATSIYTWKDSVETAPESQLILKTSAERVTDVVRRITELHPYEVPECVAVPVQDGLPAYLDWVRSSTTA